MQRLGVLDGLRGWGAVFVVLYHVFSQGLPVSPEVGSALHRSIFFNGLYAVELFFVVSGFSLSVRYLSNGDLRGWTQILSGRYFRLVVPVFVACAIVHVIAVSGLISPASSRLPAFQALMPFEPSTLHLLRFSFYSVFFDYRFSDTYIGPLWTMSFELIGSFVVLFLIVAIPRRHRALTLIACAAGIYFAVPIHDPDRPSFALFVVGAAIAQLYLDNALVLRQWIAALMVAAGCIAPTIFTPNDMFAWLVCVSLLVAGSISFDPARAFLSNPVSEHLGWLSFPLYLVHGPVLCFIGEPLARHFGGNAASMTGIGLVVVVLSFLAAYAFAPINDVSVRLSRDIGARFASNVSYFTRVT